MVIDGADETTTLEQLRERGRGGDAAELERRCDAVSPEDAYTIIYTSGTTGAPKGVVLSHGNCASVGAMVEEIEFITAGEMTYLYLPLAHAFALTVQLASFDVGSGIVYFGGDPQQIDLFAEVPLILPIQTPGWQELPNEIRASVTSLLTQLLLDHARANGAVSPGETHHDL